MSGSATLDRDIPDTDEDDIPLRPAKARTESEDYGGAPNNAPFSPAAGTPQGDDTQAGAAYEPVFEDGPQTQTREGGLSNEEQGDGTYLDNQRRADQEKTAKFAEERRNMSPEQRATAKRADRDRQKAARDRNLAENAELKNELQELRAFVNTLGGRVVHHDRARIEDTLRGYQTGIETQEQIANAAKNALAEAMTSQDGEAFARAMELRDSAVAERTRLSSLKAGLESEVARIDGAAGGGGNGQQQPTGGGAPAGGLSQKAQDNMNAFFAERPWLSRNRANPETQIVLAIDNLVARQGLKPETAAYWEAVDQHMRISDGLKHRYQRAQTDDGDGDDPPPPRRSTQPAPAGRRGPPVGGGGERGGSQAPPARPGSTQVKLSEGRVEALKSVGALASDGRTVNDRPKFDRYMAQYAKYDRDNAV